jgi:hypothetical protein
VADIRRWCDEQGIHLIEDCAHALFGISGERAVGRWGDLAIASLTKFLPVPEGGCLIANLVPGTLPLLHRPSAKSQLKAGFDIIHAAVNHGRLTGLGSFINGAARLWGRLKPKSVMQGQSEDSHNAGFTIDIDQAHLSLTTTSRWIAQHAPRERIVARRRQNYIFFTQELSGIAGFKPLLTKLPDHCAPYVFPLWVDQPDPGYAELRRLEFPVSRWDRLWPTVTTLENDSGIEWSHHVLQLACHQDLRPDELQELVSTLKKLYAPRRGQP